MMKRPPESANAPVIVRLDDRFFSRLLRMVLGLLALFLLFKLLPILSGAIFTIIIATLITAVLDPLVSFLERRGINRIGAIILVFLVFILLFSLIISLTSPIITAQVNSLASSLESESPAALIESLQNKFAKSIPILDTPQIREAITEKMQNLLIGFMEKSFSVAVSLLSSFPNLVIIGFCVFFFLKDGWKIKRAIIEAMPNRYFEISLIVVHKTVEQLSRYIRGQLIVAAAVGAMSIFALTLLDIRYSVFIGAMAGLANLIPYFGPIAGAVPAIIIGLIDTGSFGVVLAVAGAFATVQLIENVFISPYVVAKSVELHPLAIIIVILIGGALLGLWGLLLAVPTAGILKVIFSEIRWGLQNYRVEERKQFEKSLLI